MTITAGPPEALAYIGGFGAACQAVEGLWRGLAAELGPQGVRIVLRKTSSEWKITHEHESVPFYMDGSYKAAIDLKP